MEAMGKMNEFFMKKTVIAVILGQLLSLMITSTGFTSSELARKGVNAPTSQSFANYVLLALIYGAVVVFRKKALKAKWYFYALLGLIDVEANFLVVKAYQYTSLTSVTLLDCWVIPCVIILTWLFLKTKYGWKKLGGVVVCIVGIVMVVLSDVHAQDRKDQGSNPVKGDLLVIAGATLYAVTNVSEEYLVKNADRVELMGMLGVFGAVVSAIQISILERGELKSIHWSAGVVLPFSGFALAMVLFYSLVPVLLKMSGSTMLNLSLLTSDMWAVLIRVFAYRQKVDWLYFLAFAAVGVGLIIYSCFTAGVTKRSRRLVLLRQKTERGRCVGGWMRKAVLEAPEEETVMALNSRKWTLQLVHYKPTFGGELFSNERSANSKRICEENKILVIV